jgi:phage protein U
MKRTNYLLRLDNPCPESWDGMAPTAKERFGQQCAKNVVDFTGMTDDQVLVILKTFNENLCGRIDDSQLNRYLVTHTETTLSAQLFKVFAGLFLFASADSNAQELIRA